LFKFLHINLVTFFRACIGATNNIAELVVGFENTSLEVSESVGNVELCVNISQPFNAPFEIEFNLTVESRAGTADLSDFVQLTSPKLSLNEFGDHKR